jgi:hypothetical protein
LERRGQGRNLQLDHLHTFAREFQLEYMHRNLYSLFFGLGWHNQNDSELPGRQRARQELWFGTHNDKQAEHKYQLDPK